MRYSIPRSTLLVALTVAASAILSADVVVQRKPTEPHSPWLPTFGEGALTINLLPASAADAVGEIINGRDLAYFAQSFKGDGRVLQAAGFFGNGSNPVPADYTITLLDYGITAAIDTEGAFNPDIPPVVVFSDVFSLSQSAAAQLYFDFRGASCVKLEREHAYVLLIATAGGGSCSFHRLNGRDSTYAGGTAAKGLTKLSPDAFAGHRALRDAVFALYTAEP